MAKNTLLKAAWEQSRSWFCFISLLLLLSLGLFIYQAYFVTSETSNLQRQLANLQQQLNSREVKLAETGVPVSAVEQMESDLKQFSQQIPPKEDFSNFIGELFSWAEQSDLAIRQVSYRPEIEKESLYLRYGLSFSVQGTYQQLKKFIHLLENSNRLLVVETIALSGSQQKDNAASVTLQINLTTYFQEGAR